MKNTNVKLPSNKKFGYFFSLIFLIVATYFLYLSSQYTAFVLATLSVCFLIITFLNAELLLPLNKLWMQFGLLLGRIVSPIVLGILFFGLFTPYALVMKIIKRDALHLKRVRKKSYWINRMNISPQTDFKRQF
tara:strand:+ start:475 stop:873 length:399 start_codon:yes stop_codon:yes gene_type:complete